MSQVLGTLLFQKTLLVGRGHGISLLRSEGSFSKLINTIYKSGGKARETEWLSSGDAGCVCSVCVFGGGGYPTSNTVGRVAWRRRARRLQELHLRPENMVGVLSACAGIQCGFQEWREKLEWHSGTLSGDRATLESW